MRLTGAASRTRFSCTGLRGSRPKARFAHQYAHIIDMVPTVLDVLGIDPPATIRGVTQSPIQGVSFAHTFDTPTAASLHHTQYFEMLGHRAIYDGWRAVCPWPGPSFTEAGVGFGQPVSAQTLSNWTVKNGSCTTSRKTSQKTTTSPPQTTATSSSSSSRPGTWKPASMGSCRSTAAAWP